MSNATVLSVSGLTKHFGSIAAIRDVSFGVKRGEILGLIGPNGAGKTTLFECLAGVLPPNAGHVTSLTGQPLDGRDRSSVIFYMPDGIRPYADQPVSWVLNFTIGFFGGDAERAHEVVQALELMPLLRKRVGQLSKGQAKRTLLAMALLTPQPVLMIDEPFDGLDLRQMRDAASALRAHAARGRTIFLSIHQIADAARVCDRIVLLSGGTVRGEGTAAEIISRAGASDLEGAFLALT
jgi:ABC-2 type transport system ATP-binding protein